MRSAVNHQPGRAKSLFLLTQSLVIEKKWLEAREVLRKYEKVAQISADTLLLSSRIERELGNISIAASYGDMLLKIYPDSAASQRYKEELLAQTSAPLPVARKSIKLEVPEQQAQIQAAPEQETEATPELSSEPSPELSPELSPEPTYESETVSAVVPDAIEKVEAVQEQATTSAETLPLFHEVKAGENLYRISLQYNIKMQRLIEWNGLNNASDIYAGKKLRLVSPESTSLKE